MKREIKFRAWNGAYNYMAHQGTPDLETLQSFMHHYGDQYIMQFTGLKDKNGKEIYEDDILTFLGGIGRVVYDNDTAMFMVCFPFNRSRWSFDSIEGEIEVVGNIYENPELINNVISDDA